MHSEQSPKGLERRLKQMKQLRKNRDDPDCIGFHVNADKTGYMCFNQIGDISIQNGSSLKLVHKFTYLGSSVSFNKNDYHCSPSEGKDCYQEVIDNMEVWPIR